jgi:hypothetical protein
MIQVVPTATRSWLSGRRPVAVAHPTSIVGSGSSGRPDASGWRFVPMEQA